MQSCGVLDLDICPGGGDVFSDLTYFFGHGFLHGFICMDLLAWIYSHGFIHMNQFLSHEQIPVCKFDPQLE